MASIRKPKRQKHETKKIEKMFVDLKKEVQDEFPTPAKEGATPIDAQSYLAYTEDKKDDRRIFFELLSATKRAYNALRATPYFSTKGKK
jgi:hypothetical protein